MMSVIALKGLYSPTEAEKQWNYFRDCYRNARNNFRKLEDASKRSSATGIPKNKINIPSFRYYSIMTFLNDVFEGKKGLLYYKYLANKETITSVRGKEKESPASALEVSNSMTGPAESEDTSLDEMSIMPTMYEDGDYNFRPPSASSVPPASTPLLFESKKRKTSKNFDEYEKAVLQTLGTVIEPSPIQGFMLRLPEGVGRLLYRARAKRELEFFIRLKEVEEELGLLNE